MTIEQTKNQVKVIGTLKKKEIKLGVTKSEEPKPFVGGHMIVEVKNDLGIQNLRIDFFNYQFAKSGSESKIYGQLKKVHETYGIGDLIEVSASIEPNMYYNKKSDDVVDSSNLKGFWVKHVESEIQTARAEFEGFINNPQPQEDGTFKFDLIGFTYNSKPILQTIEVPVDKVAIFKKAYRPNQTAVIKYEILKGVAIETEVEQEAEDLFGDDFSMGTVTTYLTKNILTGGLAPSKSTQLNPTEVTQALNAKQIELEDILQKGRAENNGAGQGGADFGEGFDTSDFGSDDDEESMPW